MNASLPIATKPVSLSSTRAWACAMVMVLTSLLAWVTTPRIVPSEAAAPDLEAGIPKAFGDWRMVTSSVNQVDVSQGVETSQEQPYDQTVQRTYLNSNGDQIMLALAWGQRQRQEVKIHRPEVCYPAQGFSIQSLETGKPVQTAVRNDPIPTTQLLTSIRGGGFETVLYWIRVGDHYGGDGWSARWYILKQGLAGHIPDGILVRASQRISSPGEQERSQQLMHQFLTELVMATPESHRGLLAR